MLLDLNPTTKRLLYIILLFPLTWMVGLFIFINSIPEHPIPFNHEVDAVVILTGGSMRLEEGLKAFLKSNAKKVLISGVGQDVTKTDIINSLKETSIQDQITPDQMILGSMANNTATNAEETKIFMSLHGYHSILLVTSNYHMRRSLLSFTKVMPHYIIYAYPVCSENFRKSGHFISIPSLFLATNEYNKLLVFYGFALEEHFAAIYDGIIYQISELIRPILFGKAHSPLA